MIKTEIGHATPDAITVRGRNFATEILGRLDFVESFVLCALNKLPTPAEKAMLNALLVVGMDHGLTPSALSARLTYLGAPDSLQGAVAAGLLGAGTRFLGTSERAARQFMEFSGAVSPDEDAGVVAQRLVATCGRRGEILYGYGHPIHKTADPRVASLRNIARENGFYGANWLLADAVASILIERTKPLSMNATAAIGATLADMELNPTLGVALTLIGRCGGLIAHLLEEQASPVAAEVWDLVLRQDDRNGFPP